MLTRDFKFRVWYKDTDQMGIVHHSNYICYYEAARSEAAPQFRLFVCRYGGEGRRDDADSRSTLQVPASGSLRRIDHGSNFPPGVAESAYYVRIRNLQRSGRGCSIRVLRFWVSSTAIRGVPAGLRKDLWAVGKKPVIHAVFYESPVDHFGFSQEEDISDFRRWRTPDGSSVRFYPI